MTLEFDAPILKTILPKPDKIVAGKPTLAEPPGGTYPERIELQEDQLESLVRKFW